jgi:hypothetical protein
MGCRRTRLPGFAGGQVIFIFGKDLFVVKPNDISVQHGPEYLPRWRFRIFGNKS